MLRVKHPTISQAAIAICEEHLDLWDLRRRGDAIFLHQSLNNDPVAWLINLKERILRHLDSTDISRNAVFVFDQIRLGGDVKSAVLNQVSVKFLTARAVKYIVVGGVCISPFIDPPMEPLLTHYREDTIRSF